MKLATRALLPALLLAVAGTAQAADKRLVDRTYAPNEVVLVEGRLGVQATIAFAEQEHIENVAIGNSNSWQITPNKRANLVFVKPLSATARTNLTVITDKRRYYFDLVASPRGNAVYVLNFLYPDDPESREPAMRADGAPLTDAEKLAVSDDSARAPVDPAQLNFAWERKGAGKLMPSRIYDDGTATYLTWAAGTPLPAILVRNSKGEEGPVNVAVRGDVIVIDDVPGLILLRAGKASATLENRGAPRAPAAATPAALAAREQ